LHNFKKWKDLTVLELGSGTGLCSIILGMYAKAVFCTDTGDQVLDSCLINIKENYHLIRPGGQVLVRNLDWYQDVLFSSWSCQDRSLLKNIDALFASDVIYDEDLTEAFFNTVIRIMDIRPCHLYLSLEKRLNFTLSDLEVAAPAYDNFLQHLEKLKMLPNKKWHIRRIEIDFPTYFLYERSKYMELWEISVEE